MIFEWETKAKIVTSSVCQPNAKITEMLYILHKLIASNIEHVLNIKEWILNSKVVFIE